MILDNDIEVLNQIEKNSYQPSQKFAYPNDYIYNVSWLNSRFWMKYVPLDVFSALFKKNIELVTDKRNYGSWYPAIKFNDAILNFSFCSSVINYSNPELRKIIISFTLTNAGLRDVSHTHIFKESISSNSQFIEFTSVDSVDLIIKRTHSFMQEISDIITYYKTPADTWGARFI